MQSSSRKTISVIVAAAVCLSALTGADVSTAKKKEPSLPKKATVKVDKTKKLTVKNISKAKIKKTKWNAGNKKVKLLNTTKTSVKIKGVKSGTTTVSVVIKMKNGKKPYKLSTKVTVSGKKAVSEPVVTGTDVPGDVTMAPSPSPLLPSSSTDAIQTPVETATASPVSSKKPSTPRPTSTPFKPVASSAVDYTFMETLPNPNKVKRSIDPPDVMTMWDGTKVETKEQWAERKLELRGILQRYMYGMWRDGTGETLSYSMSGNQMKITIKRGEESASFKATVSKPDMEEAPEGGWPVIVSVGFMDASFCKQKGYAVISFTPTDIAADSKSSRKGAFYTLYPYNGKDWREQTGSAMAWAWGASKIVDALAGGAGAELGISAENTIVTGVSRYGKAAAAAGAFDERIKVSMPVCSGYGGMTMLRYKSDGLTYNLLPEFENDPKKGDVSDLSAWKSTGGNETIGSLSANGWFADALDGFKSYEYLPFDSHYIAALSADANRYLFIITGINSDMWSSPPGFWWTYQLARPAFELMEIPEHEAIQMHLNLHGIETVDLCKLFAFTDYHFYGKTTESSSFPEPWNELLKDFTLESLTTCVFASEANKEPYEAGKP